MIDFILDALLWPLRSGGERVIAALEAAEADIVALWASWGDA